MEQLLKLLSDGGFHSGEDVGEQLGVSRAAVWKQLKNLERLGLQIESVRGKGYRLAPGIELLDEQQVVQQLKAEVADAVTYHHCLWTTSTNDWVQAVSRSLPSRGMPICTAEYQTQGRGRRGRVWSNPFGATVCLSALWRVSHGTASLEGLSLAVGLAVLKALEDCGARNLGLKWPNDILWQGRKLCGVLLEVHGDPMGDCQVVIGIGINVKLSQSQGKAITRPVTDLETICSAPVSRNTLVSALINALYAMLEKFRYQGFKAFIKQWNAVDVFVGKQVTLNVSGNKITGIVRGVSEQGGLVLETAQGCQVFHGGEVSLSKCEKADANES